MRECGHATTVYGETLTATLAADGHRDEREWREEFFDEAGDRARYHVQQRYWRRGRGETTEDDLRLEAILEYSERRDRETSAGGGGLADV